MASYEKMFRKMVKPASAESEKLTDEEKKEVLEQNKPLEDAKEPEANTKSEETPISERRMPDVPDDVNTDSEASKEYELGGSHTVSQAPVPKIRSLKRQIDKEQGGVQIRDFPKSLLAKARAMFPELSTHKDLLVAAVALGLGPDSFDDIPEYIIDLVKQRKTDSVGLTMDEVSSRLRVQQEHIIAMSKVLSEMELGIAFLHFDRSGFRQQMPKNPADIDFLENGVTETLKRLRIQTMALRNREQLSEGRPKK